jgi:ubiquinone/menaquinone biosynthesis C-methylase UbiE
MNTPAYFNEKAKEWDNDPNKVERAYILASEIKDFLKPDKSMKAFELGCGTGLLGFFLKDSFGSIMLADSSDGMINVLKERIKNEHIENLQPVLMNLLTDDAGQETFDVIFTLMTLHHIIDLDTILFKFSKMLRHNGYLCIADLEREDGSFHENMSDFEGHYGFKKRELEKLLSRYGFRMCLYKNFYRIEKTMKSGDKKVFPLFMLIAQK